MGYVLLASLPGASSITTGGSCLRSKQYAKNYSASSYITTLRHKNGNIQKEYCAMLSRRYNLKQHYKAFEQGSTNQECERKYVVNATSGQSFEYEPQARDSNSAWSSVKDALDALYKFSRPYAAVAAVIGATSNSLMAVEKFSDLSLAFFIGWLQVMACVICFHIFGMGLNQLYDLEIDKGFGFALIIGSWPLFWGVFANCILEVIYSVDLPLLRWKASSMLAVINILANAGVARPLGYFLHMQTYVFKRPATFPRQLIFCTAILSLLFVVIAFFKDIPDSEGDKKHGIRSLSTLLGQKNVFWICISLLEMAYGVTILAGATSPFLWSKISTVLGHAVLASAVGYQVKSVDLKSTDSLQSFYLFICKLLMAEYFLIPLFR
uniref:Flavonoid prenyltransferase n=1 Tax=Sophora flavescens TaxID=49840 RepID=B1B5P3_SOPFL|nr:flavonoid prenyltransferase [Sophora flavescens]